MAHGISWAQVSERYVSSLEEGDRWISPRAGTGYHVGADGRVRGAGWQDLDGDEWTVICRAGDEITAANGDGHRLTQKVPSGTRVLVVVR